jgi:hypothetical protein
MSVQFVGKIGERFDSATGTTSTVTTSVAVPVGRFLVLAMRAGGGNVISTTTDTTARTGSGTTLSPANVTPEQYASLMFTAVATNATNAFTVSAGWTALTVNTASVYLGAAYAIQNSMDALATTWTWTTLGNAGAVTGSFTPDGGDFFNVF